MDTLAILTLVVVTDKRGYKAMFERELPRFQTSWSDIFINFEDIVRYRTDQGGCNEKGTIFGRPIKIKFKASNYTRT